MAPKELDPRGASGQARRLATVKSLRINDVNNTSFTNTCFLFSQGHGCYFIPAMTPHAYFEHNCCLKVALILRAAV